MEKQGVTRGILARGGSKAAKKQLSFHDVPDEEDYAGTVRSYAKSTRSLPDGARRGPMPVVGRGRFTARHQIQEDPPLIPRSLWANHSPGTKQEILRAVNIPDDLKQLIPTEEWSAASQRTSIAAIWDDYLSCCRSDQNVRSSSLDPMERVGFAVSDLESRWREEAARQDAQNYVYEPF